MVLHPLTSCVRAGIEEGRGMLRIIDNSCIYRIGLDDVPFTSNMSLHSSHGI